MLERSHSPFEMVSSQANIAAQDDPRYANRHVWTSIAAQSGGGPRRVVVFGVVRASHRHKPKQSTENAALAKLGA